MIFVTTGTEKFPFDRLVAEVDRLSAGGELLDQSVFIQTGSSTHQPVACASGKLLSYEEMADKIKTARLVVAHGGVGSFMICRQFGTPLIMVPRLLAFREHVDDHQLLFCRKLSALGYFDSVENMADLGAAIRRALTGSSASSTLPPSSELVEALGQLVKDWRN